MWKWSDRWLTVRRAGLIGGFLGVVLGLGINSDAHAGVAKIAVAANFQGASHALVRAFEQHSEHRVQLSFGSTGQFYAQIRHGAPFDAFFAADVKRPKRLDQERAIVPGSRFTYAEGRIVLWSTKPGYVTNNGEVLRKGDYEHLAIADPKLAPYGLAAQQTLIKFGLWKKLQKEGHLVIGQNIGQTYQLVASASAPLGFVALSQVQRPGQQIKGSSWVVPARFYAPIVQQAVLIHDTPAARAFMEFVHSAAARRIIESYGYQVPMGPATQHHAAAAE